MPSGSKTVAAGNRRKPAPAVSNRTSGRKDGLPDFQAKVDTPFALVGVRTEGGALAEIVYLPRGTGELAPVNPLAERFCAQLAKYISDPGYRFKLPLRQVGTAFQRRVWDVIASIPRGETLSYGEIARTLRSGPRAVGQACGTNYFPLVIPCHRVVAANGLGGFAHNSSGYLIEVKRWLLQHEQIASRGT
jgi:methylated-DNA-[protein]-cysteine S-methyltransferase